MSISQQPKPELRVTFDLNSSGHICLLPSTSAPHQNASERSTFSTGSGCTLPPLLQLADRITAEPLGRMKLDRIHGPLSAPDLGSGSTAEHARCDMAPRCDVCLASRRLQVLTSFPEPAVRHRVSQSESLVGFKHRFPVSSAQQPADLLLEHHSTSLRRHFQRYSSSLTTSSKPGTTRGCDWLLVETGRSLFGVGGPTAWICVDDWRFPDRNAPFLQMSLAVVVTLSSAQK